MSLDDTLAAIDAATGCQWCQGPLGESPSQDFCSESHQMAWARQHATDAEAVLGREWQLPRRTGDPRVDLMLAALALATAPGPDEHAVALERMEQVRADAYEAFRVIREAMQGMVRQFQTAAQGLGKAVEAFVPAEVREVPEDPQARALRLHQQRNTGPARNPHARLGRGQ